jgi:hypothetical protein
MPKQAPLAGEVPFFLGINHLKAIKAGMESSDVQLLVSAVDHDSISHGRNSLSICVIAKCL